MKKMKDFTLKYVVDQQTWKQYDEVLTILNFIIQIFFKGAYNFVKNAYFLWKVAKKYNELN